MLNMFLKPIEESGNFTQLLKTVASGGRWCLHRRDRPYRTPLILCKNAGPNLRPEPSADERRDPGISIDAAGVSSKKK